MTTNQTGGIIFGSLFLGIIVLVAVLLVAFIIPAIAEGNLYRLKQNDVDLIQKSIANHITKTSSIPKSWDDISQINLEHYQANQIVSDLKPQNGFGAGERWTNAAIDDGFDQVGVFISTRCQENGSDSIIAPGDNNQIAILFERGSELVCQQLSGFSLGSTQN